MLESEWVGDFCISAEGWLDLTATTLVPRPTSLGGRRHRRMKQAKRSQILSRARVAPPCRETSRQIPLPLRYRENTAQGWGGGDVRDTQMRRRPFRTRVCFSGRIPRVAPWAVMRCPVGAWIVASAPIARPCHPAAKKKPATPGEGDGRRRGQATLTNCSRIHHARRGRGPDFPRHRLLAGRSLRR